MVSGAAEADFDLGMRVNIDGTRGLLEACRRYAQASAVAFHQFRRGIRCAIARQLSQTQLRRCRKTLTASKN